MLGRSISLFRRPSVSLRSTWWRSLFIQTQETPNPNSLKFMPGKPVLESGTRDFQNPKQAEASPLAKSLFKIEGVQGTYFGSDFITVNVTDGTDWAVVKPYVFSTIMDHYASNKPVILNAEEQEKATKEQGKDTAPDPNDSPVVATIKDIIASRIRPSVQEDGGDVVFIKFENAIVYVQMQGSCVGCPSSGVTLKNGIENMLMHYVPEVEGVEEWVEATDERVLKYEADAVEDDKKKQALGKAAIESLERGLAQAQGKK